MSAGEVSGDHYISSLIKALREEGYSGELWGMGGVEAGLSGLEIKWRGDSLQVMGFTEVFSAIPRLFRLADEIVKTIMEKKPEAVVVVDSPDFHLPLIKKIRKAGYQGKIFYISPPTVWAWREYRVRTLKKYVDLCLPVFGFEHRFISERGCRSAWTGTPLLEDFYNDEAKKNEMPPLENDGKIIAFMPGSRKNEIKTLVPVMREAAEVLASEGWTPVFSVAPGLNEEVRRSYTEELRLSGFRYYEGPGKALMKAAKCVVAASGTITVEALVIGCYMVVVYKINKLSEFIGRLVIKIKLFAMANILVGHEVYPELLQDNANKEKILAEAHKWLQADDKEKEIITDELGEARKALGNTGVYRFWAQKVMEELANA